MRTYPTSVDRFAFRFKNYTYRSIQLCLNDGQGLAATILLCCSIDLLARFNSGDPLHSGNSLKYIDFLKTYFPTSHDPFQFYRFVRCGLVHSYSMQDRYTILCRDEAWARRIHLVTDPRTGKTVVNPYQLLADIQKAVRAYIEDVKGNPSKLAGFIKVHRIIPLKQQMSRWKKLKHLTVARSK